MSSTDAPFRIVVYSAAGVPLGESSSVTSLSTNSSLDKIGSCTITIPATEPIVALITAGVYIDCFDEVDGYIGRYYYKTRSIRDGSTGGMMQLTCDDNLTSLQRYFVGYRRKYSNENVDVVIADLLAVAGWTGVIDTGIGLTTVDYEGESVFAAIDVLRDRWYQHFRLGTEPNQFEFGSFGADSGVVLQNLEGQMQALFEANSNIAHVSSISETISTETLYNRIIATGGGQGSEAELTIEDATFGTYPVLSGLNQDGSSYYYIQDDDSIAQYGVRTKVVKFPSIRPLANNVTDIQRAVEMVKVSAEAYLKQHKDPIVSYSLEVIGLREGVRVGDQVRLDYRSTAPSGNEQYLRVNDMFYLMDIRYNRSTGGQRSASLTICTTTQRRTSDTDVIVDVVRDISVLKLHVQPYPYWTENTWQEPISSGDGVPTSFYGERTANFKVEIDNSVTKLTKVRLRFKSFPLSTTSLGDAATGIFCTPISGQYPSDISIFINGVDRTTFYGGKWNPAGNVQVDQILDITEDIKNAVGGIYQDHSIVFKCSVPVANQELSVYPPGHSFPAKVTNGWIQLNVRVQGVTQGIVPT